MNGEGEACGVQFDRPPSPTEAEGFRALGVQQVLVELGREFRNRRLDRQMSIRELADVAHVSKSYIEKIERGGVRYPEFLPLISMARSLGMSMQCLIAPFEVSMVRRNVKKHEPEQGPRFG